MRAPLSLVVTLPLLVLATACPPPEALPDAGPDALPRITTPRWAFEPWISKDISDRDDTYAFVDGFREHDIPVGVVVLDSPWETNYNTFVPSEERYPGFEDMVRDFAEDGVRLVLWTTQMINYSSFDLEPGGDRYDGPSPNLAEAAREDYLVNDGETYLWWKGEGAGLDFFHEEATAWWRAQQNPLLDMGVAGWKLDFGEQYITTRPIKTAAGEKTLQEYSEAYYADFWQHGVTRSGSDDFVTMVRGYDESYGFEPRFYARPEHAPVVWMGDNTRDWVGLEDALDHLFRSARAGYVVVGSDIGGYLSRTVALETIPFDTDNFIRWTAAMGLAPFFQLHGQGNLTPWTIPDETRSEETVAAYRYWATLHHELVPFFYSLAEEAYAGGDNILRPLGDEADWPGDWRFLVGDAFLVAAMTSADRVRDVELPSGSDWYEWFAPAAAPHPGGSVLAGYDSVESYRIPVFVRSGAIVPMTIDSDVTGVADAFAADALTLLVWPAEEPSRFLLHEDEHTIVIEAVREGAVAAVTLDGALESTWLAITVAAEPTEVALDGSALSRSGAVAELAAGQWTYDEGSQRTWLRLAPGDGVRVVELRLP